MHPQCTARYRCKATGSTTATHPQVLERLLHAGARRLGPVLSLPHLAWGSTAFCTKKAKVSNRLLRPWLLLSQLQASCMQARRHALCGCRRLHRRFHPLRPLTRDVELAPPPRADKLSDALPNHILVGVEGGACGEGEGKALLYGMPLCNRRDSAAAPACCRQPHVSLQRAASSC